MQTFYRHHLTLATTEDFQLLILLADVTIQEGANQRLYLEDQ
jgi:hypothetical protein